MADRHEFKVVIEGVSVDKARINAAIQKAVASALIDAGEAGSAKAASASGGDATIWASFGRTNGIVYRPIDPKVSASLKSAGLSE